MYLFIHSLLLFNNILCTFLITILNQIKKKLKNRHVYLKKKVPFTIGISTYS